MPAGYADLEHVQNRLDEWARRNFGEDRPSYHPLLGAIEELGELAHAHLKQEQGIRTNEDHEAEARDAVGDVIFYLMDYCNIRGWSIAEIITETENEVFARDWTKNREDGSVE